MESVSIFGTLRQDRPALSKMVLIPDEGLQQKGAFDDPQRLPDVVLAIPDDTDPTDRECSSSGPA